MSQTSNVVRTGHDAALKNLVETFFDSTVQPAALQAASNQSLRAPLPSDNLYIKNLPPGLCEGELYSVFSPYGEVLSCRILCQGDAMGEGGSAMVRMGTIQQAMLAIQGLLGQCIRGSLHPLIIRFADNAKVKAKKQILARHQLPWQGEGLSGTPCEFQRNICSPSQMHVTSEVSTLSALHHVGQPTVAADAISPLTLPPHEQLSQLSLQSGTNLSPFANLQWPGADGTGSMPYTQNEVQNPFQLQSTTSTSISSTQIAASLYVSNLPPEANKLFLYEIFSPFGAILSIKVLNDEKGFPRGVAFVNFSDPSCAMAAVSVLQNLTIGDRKIQVAFQTRKSPVSNAMQYHNTRFNAF